jgi:hypothetical protein
MTATIGLGLEPPLSPPVVGGRAGHGTMAADGLPGLPTPPPAIRPPQGARPTPEAHEVLPVRAVSEQARPEADVATIAPAEAELPTMAPPEEPAAAAAPVTDYFAVDSPVELEPVQPSEIQTPELSLVASPDAATANGPRGVLVVLRLQDGEQVAIAEHENRAAAMEAAREVIEQLASTSGKAWPFHAGRFIRPEVIVSIDLVEGGPAGA